MIGSQFQQPTQVSELLIAWKEGDDRAFDRLVPIIYDELRKRAHYHLRYERSNHTLQTTALVHETYLKLALQREKHLENRGQFFWLASEMMRRILVDYARGRDREKRGGDAETVSLEATFQIAVENSEVDLVLLDECLKKLAEMDPQQAKIVELRYFGGCSLFETAEVLNISMATVKRDWTVAKAWLKYNLSL